MNSLQGSGATGDFTVIGRLQLKKIGVLSTDELELRSFFDSHRSVSKTERKFLLKYVVKGLPESVRGRVSVHNFMTCIVLGNMLRSSFIHGWVIIR